MRPGPDNFISYTFICIFVYTSVGSSIKKDPVINICMI